MERREQKQADLRAGAVEERGDLQQKDGQAGVNEEAGKEIHPAEGREDEVGKVGQQIHARGVKVTRGCVPDDLAGGCEDEVQRRYLIVVEIAYGEQRDKRVQRRRTGRRR